MAHADRKLKQEIEINVDGKDIDMLPFVKELIGNPIVGMVEALKGCEDCSEITIKIKKNDE